MSSKVFKKASPSRLVFLFLCFRKQEEHAHREIFYRDEQFLNDIHNLGNLGVLGYGVVIYEDITVKETDDLDRNVNKKHGSGNDSPYANLLAESTTHDDECCANQ